MTWERFVRLVSAMVCLVMFVTDYGLKWWADRPPVYVYILLIAISVGVDAKALRNVILGALSAKIGGPLSPREGDEK